MSLLLALEYEKLAPGLYQLNLRQKFRNRYVIIQFTTTIMQYINSTHFFNDNQQ